MKFYVGSRTIPVGRYVRVNNMGTLSEVKTDKHKPIGVATTRLRAKRMVVSNDRGHIRDPEMADPELTAISAKYMGMVQ